MDMSDMPVAADGSGVVYGNFRYSRCFQVGEGVRIEACNPERVARLAVSPQDFFKGDLPSPVIAELDIACAEVDIVVVTSVFKELLDSFRDTNRPYRGCWTQVMAVRDLYIPKFAIVV